MLHAAGEGIRLQTKAASRHLRHRRNSSKQLATPAIHDLLPLREGSRQHWLRIQLGKLSDSGAFAQSM
jgi:hypothetical protein